MPVVIGTTVGLGIYLAFPDPSLQGAAATIVICIFASLIGQWIALR